MALKSRIGESPEVDLNPMIDIIFQLMIFFMVIMAVAVVFGVAVKFPSGGPANKDNQKKEKRIAVYVQSDRIESGHVIIQDGILKINDEEIPMTRTPMPTSQDQKEWTMVYTKWVEEREKAYEDLEAKMKELLDQGYKNDVLVIQGDMKTYHGKTMRVIDKGKKLKIDGFSLVTPSR
jgi:biopolymer transport protein ExbD